MKKADFFTVANLAKRNYSNKCVIRDLVMIIADLRDEYTSQEYTKTDAIRDITVLSLYSGFSPKKGEIKKALNKCLALCDIAYSKKGMLNVIPYYAITFSVVRNTFKDYFNFKDYSFRKQFFV